MCWAERLVDLICRSQHRRPSDHDPEVVGRRPAPQPDQEMLAPETFDFEAAKAASDPFWDPSPPYSEREPDRRT